MGLILLLVNLEFTSMQKFIRSYACFISTHELMATRVTERSRSKSKPTKMARLYEEEGRERLLDLEKWFAAWIILNL